jgi:cytochrome c biogenesis protein ResB
MPQDNNRTSIRSTAVNEIIANKPGFLIRWANLIFLLILLLILAAVFFIRYPDVVPAAGRLVQSNAGYYAEVVVASDKAAGIQSGQKVLLKLAAYPFREYGKMEGKIDTFFTNTTDSSCLIKVLLTNGLVTNYQKKIPYKDGLMTDADIITADKRLSERLIKKLKGSFSE